MRATSRRAANSSSRAVNTKNHQNKAVDIWTKILDKGNLTDHPTLSIGSCHPSISSLPLRGDKDSLYSVKAEHEPTNLAPGVGEQGASRILITKGFMDFLVVGGRRLLQFHRVRVHRAGGTR